MIVEVLEDIKNHLIANLTRLGVTGEPSFGIGRRDLDVGADWPRIVFVPIGGHHDKRQLTANDRQAAVELRRMGDPKPIWTRHLRIDAHVWGKDITHVEKLVGHLVAAIEELDAGTYSMVGEAWDTEGASVSGEKAIFTFELRMPISREPLKFVAATPLITDPTQIQESA